LVTYFIDNTLSINQIKHCQESLNADFDNEHIIEKSKLLIRNPIFIDNSIYNIHEYSILQYEKTHANRLILLDDVNIKSKQYIVRNGKLYSKILNKKSLVNNTCEKINNLIEKHYPFINHIDTKNACFAGGFCVNLMMNILQINDFDIFLYCKDEEFPTTLYDLIHSIHNAYTKFNPNSNVTYMLKKNTNVMDIIYKHDDVIVKFQIILVKYYRMVDILKSFDIDSCCVIYKDNKTYLNNRSMKAFTYMANSYNPEYFTSLYIYRLQKYVNRGFDIFVPTKYSNHIKINEENYKEINNVIYSTDIHFTGDEKVYYLNSSNPLYGNKPLYNTSPLYDSTEINIENNKYLEEMIKQGLLTTCNDINHFTIHDNIFYINEEKIVRIKRDEITYEITK
jgi:hypothetical protein